MSKQLGEGCGSGDPGGPAVISEDSAATPALTGADRASISAPVSDLSVTCQQKQEEYENRKNPQDLALASWQLSTGPGPTARGAHGHTGAGLTAAVSHRPPNPQGPPGHARGEGTEYGTGSVARHLPGAAALRKHPPVLEGSTCPQPLPLHLRCRCHRGPCRGCS